MDLQVLLQCVEPDGETKSYFFKILLANLKTHNTIYLKRGKKEVSISSVLSAFTRSTKEVRTPSL